LVAQYLDRVLPFVCDGSYQCDIITLRVNPDIEDPFWPGDDDRVQQIPFLASAAAISALKVSVSAIAE
jgi:hypothetical protein